MVKESETTFRSLRDLIQELSDYFAEQKPELSVKQRKKQLKLLFAEEVGRSFVCEQNQDIVSFLKNRAIDSELHHATRTFILENQNGEWLGFYTLALKTLDIGDFSKSDKKAFIYTGKSPNNISHISAYLIAQLGKNDRFKTVISGKCLLNHAINTIYRSIENNGGKIILLDSVNHPKVLNFYREYGFVEYGDLIDDGAMKYQPMFLNLTDLTL